MDDILRSKQVAAMLQVTVDTLRVWRKHGKGPAWFPLNESTRPKIRYRKEDVIAYIEHMKQR